MNKPIAIVAGEPNSISSEIIFKVWKLKKQFKHRPFFIIGSISLLNLQKKKINFRIKIKEIPMNFKIKDLKGSELPVYNINYNQRKTFEKITSNSNNYIFKCIDTAYKFAENKKIGGFINCPVSKESLFKKKHQGVTEYLSNKTGLKNKGVMLIYNKDMSVCPITSHIPISQISKKITERKIIQKVKIINNFYRKNLKKNPNFSILGLNPHNFSLLKNSVDKKTIPSAIKKLKKLKIKVCGPTSPDSSFMKSNKKKIDVIIGMYHDQVLTPFKALYNFKAINITLGLPFIRISPDHGTAVNIVGKNIANESSLFEAIKFFNNIK